MSEALWGYVEIACSRCKEKFALNGETFGTLKRNTHTFHCPWGHPQHFPLGKTAAEKLQEQLDSERRARQWAEQDRAFWQDQARSETKRASAMKGQVTKLKKRAAAGVCPCCNRTFQNLARHMNTKHAGFTAEEAAPEGATIQ